MKLRTKYNNIFNSGKIIIFLILSVLSITFYNPSNSHHPSTNIEFTDQLEMDGIDFEILDTDMIRTSRSYEIIKKVAFLDDFFTKSIKTFEAPKPKYSYFQIESVRTAVHSFLYLLTLF